MYSYSGVAKFLLPGISPDQARLLPCPAVVKSCPTQIPNLALADGEIKARKGRIQVRVGRGPDPEDDAGGNKEENFGAGGNEHQRAKWAGENKIRKTTRAESRTQERRARGREGESRLSAGGDEKQCSGTRGRRPARAGAAFVSTSSALRGCTGPMSPRPPGARAARSP